VTIARILSIAGSDSGGGAGIQADIKTITMLGGHAMTAITAITAQNSMGVTQVMPVLTEMVLAQIDAVLSDIGVDAIKIGMIGSAATVLALAERLDPKRLDRAHAPISVVFDPVMVATSGAVLADPETVAAFHMLMRRATLVTPNVPELEALTGTSIATVDELAAVGLALSRETGTQILAKGGHLPTDEIVDVHVIDGRVESHVPRPRIATRHSHGTGCTLSSAIATRLGSGWPMAEAITDAQLYVRAALNAAPGLGEGHGPMGHGLGHTYFPPAR
jgi:hydroxymethylpyrimidine/phosphomethylpyrimidine kinase